MKVCPHCKEEKLLEGFYKRRNGLPTSWCKKCANKRQSEIQDEDERKALRARQREWAKRNPEKIRAKRKRQRERNRLLVLQAYGNKCSCCNEGESIFLTVDHINGREENHPDRNNLYAYLVRESFPKENYRILCFNCNCGRQVNGGVCPHQAG